MVDKLVQSVYRSSLELEFPYMSCLGCELELVVENLE
jgi:hypothetical protein